MRIVLAATASYEPPRGGSTRSNLAWLEALRAAGHECHIVAGAGATPVALRAEIAACRPDWVLVSSEDLGHVLLAEAHRAAPGRVVYLAHTPQFFPFGPASWNPDARASELVARSAAVVAIGETMARYIGRHAGRPAVVIHPPIYGRGPWREMGSFGENLVAMINPCAIKGIPIFLELARRFPRVRFGALEGWGTTAGDRQDLAATGNVTLLASCRDIDEFLERVSVLLVPSLWFEGFGLIVMQAMLRAIPVVASDCGGLAEAKLGTRFVIPVRPIERYDPVFDEQGLPRAVVPAQDLTGWEEALGILLNDRAAYETESRLSRERAAAFVNSLRGEALGEMLEALSPAEAAAQRVHIEQLSPEKRALLRRRLDKR